MTLASFGILGTGMLGHAMMQAIARSDLVPAGQLWALNRSGSAPDLADCGVIVTNDLHALVAACETILLCVPPAQAQSLGFDGRGKLVVSVMAGVTVTKLRQLVPGAQVVRAMSSPAASDGLAYSPWFAAPDVTAAGKARVRALLRPCGLEDELTDEDHIAHFTAITGPVPGFVAAFAEAVQDYAQEAGIPSEVAGRAVRQLFLASGHALANDPREPAAHVQEMIDYAGTTAAGLRVLRDGPLKKAVAEGLHAATARVRTIADG